MSKGVAETKGVHDNPPIILQPSASFRRVSCSKLILDALFAYFYLGPLTVVYWFSTWLLLTTIILVDVRQTISLALSACLGYSVHVLATCYQEHIISSTSKQSAPVQFIIKRLYTYVLAFAVVNQWRAVWEFLDVYTGITVTSCVISVLAPLGVLLSLRCLRVFLAPPALLDLDVDLEAYFTISTYFNQKPGTWKHVADSIFSVVIIHSLMVSMWRGLWGLFDLKLVPDDFSMSGVYSLIISYSLAIVLFILRDPFISLSAWLEKKHDLLKLLFENLVLCLHFIYVVLHWRGFWILLDTHFLEPPLRYWVCHTVGFVAMTLSFASNSLVPRGIPRDGSCTNGEGLRLDMHYISTLREWLREQKQVSVIENGRQCETHSPESTRL